MKKQLKLIKYLDAIYTPNKNLNINNASIIVKGGEGFKLNSKIYNVMSTSYPFKTFSKDFPPDSKQFLNALQKNHIIRGITICDPTSAAITLFRFDLHAVVAIEDPFDSEFLLIFGILTSTKGDITILLSDKQLDLSEDTNINYQKLHPKRHENDKDIYFFIIIDKTILQFLKTKQKQKLKCKISDKTKNTEK